MVKTLDLIADKLANNIAIDNTHDIHVANLVSHDLTNDFANHQPNHDANHHPDNLDIAHHHPNNIHHHHHHAHDHTLQRRVCMLARCAAVALR